MKKRLEAELISIAHRILKLKNKSEVDQLILETRKLYEALAVLKFYGDNYEQVKSEISKEEIEEKLAVSMEEKETVVIPEVIQAKIVTEKVEETTPEIMEEETASEAVSEEIATEKEDETEEIVEVTETNVEKEEEEVETTENLAFEPIFELEEEEIEEEKIEIKSKNEPQQISFEDLLGQNYSEPVFVKPDELPITPSENKTEKASETIEETKEIEVEKTSILNEKLAAGINIGLNDRVGFVKYLFAESNEDFNRVLSQLNTFDTFKDAKKFIAEMVKPDYDNWKGQEDYEERFMELVERKFN